MTVTLKLTSIFLFVILLLVYEFSCTSQLSLHNFNYSNTDERNEVMEAVTDVKGKLDDTLNEMRKRFNYTHRNDVKETSPTHNLSDIDNFVNRVPTAENKQNVNRPPGEGRSKNVGQKTFHWIHTVPHQMAEGVQNVKQQAVEMRRRAQERVDRGLESIGSKVHRAEEYLGEKWEEMEQRVRSTKSELDCVATRFLPRNQIKENFKHQMLPHREVER
eukprot:TRINITY_DN9143_c0_g2_i1.p1 TRINITY_DN9143_c0_g2~~TRINITY_DN9143_c0_g2_i1.p1  ORF type:complete len:217 (-),score=24.02 TRINITY_DN9143_c0_g2_i1:187-837(-)